jgi:hypothetical protein
VPSNLIASGTWQWQRAAAGVQSRHVVQQIDTEPGEVDPRLVNELRSLATSAQSVPIISTYRDIGYNPLPRRARPRARAGDVSSFIGGSLVKNPDIAMVARRLMRVR